MSVQIGIPTEIKPLEGRVALTPAAVSELVLAGHKVSLQQGSGLGSGYDDSSYKKVGAEILATAEEIYAFAEVLVKVKEPIGHEIDLLKTDQILFCYLHLAANKALMQRLCDIGLTAIAFETVVEANNLPLLQPMSHIAGRIAVQAGTHLLHTAEGGKGVLLGGVAGVERGNVVVIGAGNAGAHAALIAAGMGANVTVFDLNPQRLNELQLQAPNISTRYANAVDIGLAVKSADLLIGAVLLPGAAAPRVVTRKQIASMQKGSVVADIAVDQGGCIETTHGTTYDNPTYVEEGVTHFCVTNMPGAVPRTATQALSGALLPYLRALLQDDWKSFKPLLEGINVMDGRVVHPALVVKN